MLVNTCWQGGVNDFPYLNFLKLLGSIQAGTYAWPGILSADGYPVGEVATSIAGTINPMPVNYSGQWVVKWTGTITGSGMQLQGPITVVSGGSFVNGATTFNMRLIGTNGRVVFTWPTPLSSMAFNFLSSTTYTDLSNVILCRVADEALIDAGEVVNPDYVAFFDALNPTIVRFMDLMGTVVNILTRHAHRKGVGHVTFSGATWRPEAWAGVLTGTDTYTCPAATDTPVAWTDGEIVQFQVANANTVTTPTLDVGARGAKTIVRLSGAALAVGTMAANTLATGIYDATLDKVLYSAGSLSAGPSIETLVALANALDRDAWFSLPPLMDDASYTAMATYIKANLNSNLTAYIELGNEIWNFVFNFTHLFKARGAARGFSSGDARQEYGEYAKRTREVLGIFTDVWAGETAPRLRRVIAMQAFGVGGLTGATNKYRFQGFDLGAWGFNVAPNRPIDYADVISPAFYYSGTHCEAFDANYTGTLETLLGWADDYDSGNATLMEAALDAVDADIRGASAVDQTLYRLNADIYPTWETIAASYTGKSVIPYEGGLEINAPSTSRLTVLGIDTGYTAKITTLFTAYKNSYRLKVLVSAQMRQFMAQAHSEMPGWYMTCGANQWSLNTGNLYSDRYKSWDALVARNAGKESFKLALTA